MEQGAVELDPEARRVEGQRTPKSDLCLSGSVPKGQMR